MPPPQRKGCWGQPAVSTPHLVQHSDPFTGAVEGGQLHAPQSRKQLSRRAGPGLPQPRVATPPTRGLSPIQPPEMSSYFSQTRGLRLQPQEQRAPEAGTDRPCAYMFPTLGHNLSPGQPEPPTHIPSSWHPLSLALGAHPLSRHFYECHHFVLCSLMGQ